MTSDHTRAVLNEVDRIITDYIDRTDVPGSGLRIRQVLDGFAAAVERNAVAIPVPVKLLCPSGHYVIDASLDRSLSGRILLIFAPEFEVPVDGVYRVRNGAGALTNDVAFMLGTIRNQVVCPNWDQGRACGYHAQAYAPMFRAFVMLEVLKGNRDIRLTI